jgi:hypothetical protein
MLVTKTVRARLAESDHRLDQMVAGIIETNPAIRRQAVVGRLKEEFGAAAVFASIRRQTKPGGTLVQFRSGNAMLLALSSAFPGSDLALLKTLQRKYAAEILVHFLAYEEPVPLSKALTDLEHVGKKKAVRNRILYLKKPGKGLVPCIEEARCHRVEWRRDARRKVCLKITKDAKRFLNLHRTMQIVGAGSFLTLPAPTQHPQKV